MRVPPCSPLPAAHLVDRFCYFNLFIYYDKKEHENIHVKALIRLLWNTINIKPFSVLRGRGK